MYREEPINATGMLLIKSKAKDYVQLMKPNLSFMIVFSSVIGYLMAPGITFAWKEVLILFAGGMLVTNGANTINQIIERYSDRLMNRTKGRPLPEGRMGIAEAWFIAIASGVGGVGLLITYFNLFAGLLSLLSLLLYAFAYTPLKKIHPISVFVGAIPGALPPLIGYVAATNHLNTEGWILFLIQFFWQFPHFWAIAWVGYDDYERAGIRMLPSREKETRFTGLQCMFYAIMLIPLAVAPRIMNMTGNIGMIVCILAGIMYFVATVFFYLKNDYTSAKRVMFTSFFYLPVVLLALVLDKM